MFISNSRSWVNVAVLGALVAGFGAAAFADDGVTPNSILLGQSCALKGSAAGLGSSMQAGLQVYFDQINAAGGVNGRKVELKTVNDGYEPEKCVEVTTMLIDKAKVFALIGEVGTPTSKVAIPLATEKNVPFIAAFTGAELLRTPFNPYVVNVRASYFQEMEELAKLLVEKKGFKNIACFWQNDAYGQAGLDGIKRALEARKMTLVAEGTYERNTTAINEGLQKIAPAKPDAVVMVGAYKACAEFIKAAKADANLKDSTFCNISFVGTDNLLAELGATADDKCIISQVVPFPWDTRIPVVKEYQEAMKHAGKADMIGFVSLEGYLAGKFFCQALSKVQGEPTRKAFLDTVASVGSFDLGGVTLNFGSNDHQGSDTVFLTTVAGGKVVPLTTDGAIAAVPNN